MAILAGLGISSVTSLQSFRYYIAADAGHAGDIAARPGEARDESCRHRVEGGHEHDRDLARGISRRQHRRRSRSEENVHAMAD
jgi:hypothetical protein